MNYGNIAEVVEEINDFGAIVDWESVLARNVQFIDGGITFPEVEGKILKLEDHAFT